MAVSTPRRALVTVVFMALAAGCGGSSDATRLPASDRDQYDERIDEINRTFEEFRVAGNACKVEDPGCFEAALADSGFEAALVELSSTVDEIGAGLEPGECKSSLESLEGELSNLSSALAALKADVQAGDVEGLGSSAPAVADGWGSAVDAQAPSSEAC